LRNRERFLSNFSMDVIARSTHENTEAATDASRGRLEASLEARPVLM
jgi:hypothetical protein